jgi:hypothetical protein
MADDVLPVLRIEGLLPQRPLARLSEKGPITLV